ncbi:MDR family MFS transporter [Bifidobacterium samirii]|uniref:Permease n=1 Tax=Bifidobacterium samirii TaxID=2306974 RepID=A0A430FV99_9BIFI|nr:MFS transporter [Bifidobacterium samirii]RSX57417.1 permease [Bifidobacterium samirii]
MRKERRIFGLPVLYWGLWLAILFLWMGRFVISFMSMYLVSDMHVDAGTAGTVVSMFGFGGIFGCLFGGALSDRFGRQSMIIIGESGAAVMLVLLSFIDDPTVMGAALLIYGAIASVPTPAIAAYIADVVPLRDQKRAYTLQTWAVNFGYATGPIIANHLVKVSYSLMFYAEAAILIGVTVMLVCFFRAMRRAAAVVVSAATCASTDASSPDVAIIAADATVDAAAQPAGATGGKPVSMIANYRRALTDWPLMSMVLLMFGYTIAYFQSTSGLPIAMTQLGMGTDEYSHLLTINGGIMCLLQIPAIALFNRMSNTRVLVLGMLVTAVGYACQIHSGVFLAFAFSTVMWSLGELGTFPIAATTVANLAPADCRGTYQGVYNLVWSLSQGVAPLVGGWIIAGWGAQTLWTACTAMFILVAIGLYVTKGARERAVARNLAAAMA